ncbi:urease subunit beta [Rubrobacter aplysinae]|uniref:urease subunit beta n=1 Tax=Rubrobacter aplysinae TaxID=909625 RepID=UPI00064BED83|nr:urease subunit beta [Rubrobacter aplysinae]
MIPGESMPKEGYLEFNTDRETVSLSVTNTGDRPVMVGSHYHFFEANKALSFDREKAYGMHLNLHGGSYVRFEPGDEHDLELAAFAGNRVVHGFNGLVEGPLDDPQVKEAALRSAREQGFIREDG